MYENLNLKWYKFTQDQDIESLDSGTFIKMKYSNGREEILLIGDIRGKDKDSFLDFGCGCCANDYYKTDIIEVAYLNEYTKE